MNGVFYNAKGPGFQGCNQYTAYCYENSNGVGFDSSRSSPIYRRGCGANRPKSFGVYIWKRIG